MSDRVQRPGLAVARTRHFGGIKEIFGLRMGTPHEKASLFTKDAVGYFEAEEKLDQ